MTLILMVSYSVKIRSSNYSFLMVIDGSDSDCQTVVPVEKEVSG